MLAQLFSLRLDPLPLIDRVLFWAGIALLLAPFLDVHLPQTVPTGGPARSMPGLGINPGSVLRGLVLFNLLIGLQVVTDLSILIGGASLPQGMTYAEYAHRGAYPLLATALLAGAFALLSRPYLREHPAIRPLMLLWLGQNLVLCGAALLRLDLYISAYGLTYLRAWSLIWMVLVAAGLALTLWQVVVGHDNRWVMLRTGAMGLVTLYVAAFVNFAGVIATYNIRNGHLDTWYLCQLGPMAAGALLSGGVIDKNGWNDAGSCFVDFPQQQDWREWGFRSWRVQSYVAAVEMRGAPDENPGRR